MSADWRKRLREKFARDLEPERADDSVDVTVDIELAGGERVHVRQQVGTVKEGQVIIGAVLRPPRKDGDSRR